jgi:hypothetical protein
MFASVRPFECLEDKIVEFELRSSVRRAFMLPRAK